MADPESMEELCAMCNTMGLHACSGCHAIRYCSKLCQKTDWPLHKLLCKSFKDFSDDQRPQPHDDYIYKRAIHFPEHGNAPQFVWMRHFGHSELNRAVVDPTSLPTDCADLKPLIKFSHNAYLGRPVTGWVGIEGRSWGLNADGIVKVGHQNTSLLKVDKELSDWAGGALVAFGHDGADFSISTALETETWQDQVYDLGPVHLRHVVDHLRLEHNKTGREFELYSRGGDKQVKGVRINCIGDKIVCFRGGLESVDVSQALCTEESDLNSDVAAKIGIPLSIRKIPHALCWRGRKLIMPYSPTRIPCGMNVIMQLFDLKSQCQLFPQNDEEMQQFNVSSLVRRLDAASADLGSCVVVRKDGEPLHPIFMEALQTYIRLKLKTSKMTPSHPSPWEKPILDDMSGEDWEEFFEDFDPEKDYDLDSLS